MRCPLCKGEMAIVQKVMKEDGIAFETYKCASCKEELMNGRQLKELASKYRKLRSAKEVTFAKWGNSIAVRIPRAIAELFDINAGKHGLLTKERDGIKILPL